MHPQRPTLILDALHFATAPVTTPWYAIYESSNNTPSSPSGLTALGPLQDYGRGARISTPEWVQGQTPPHPICLQRGQQVHLRVRLRVSFPLSQASEFYLSAVPALDGNTAFLQTSAWSYTFPASTAEMWINFPLTGHMPLEIGRYLLRIQWSVASVTGDLGMNAVETTLPAYSIVDTPLRPEFDSTSPGEDGASARVARDTLTGTEVRLDRLMLSCGGPSRRHSASSAADIEDVLWNLHSAVNNTGPNRPPHFDGDHDEHITHSGHNQWSEAGIPLNLEDQWLMWVTSPPSADCS